MVFCLVFLITSLIFEWFKPPITFLLVVSIVSLSGVYAPQEVLHLIANEQIAVILMLMVLGNIMRRSVLIDMMFKSVFKDDIGSRGFLSRLYLLVGGLSAFFNNTPLVAILIPHVSQWGKRNKISPSKILLPLSYASVIGGGITLIGTSANLIVDKLYQDNGGEGFLLFDFAYFGIPLFIVGFIYVLFAGKFLKDRVPFQQSLQRRDYFVETRVKSRSDIIGKSVEEAELRNLKDLYLVEIIRRDRIISPVSRDEEIMEGDLLMFAGDTEKVLDFLANHEDIELVNDTGLVESKQEVVEVVVPYTSSLVGKKIKDSNFRAKFDAAIIGVRRNGEKVNGKIGSLVTKRGDMFLCVTGKDFDVRVDRANELYIISKIQQINNIGVKASLVVLSSMALSMVLAGLNILSLFNSIILMLTIIAASKLVPFEEIRRSFNYNFLLVGGGALVFGSAMKDTGVAEFLANNMLNVFTGLGDVGTLVGLFLVTNLLASFMTNIAAIAIVYPIAVFITQQMGIDLYLTSMVIAFGGSKIFLTPIGYQTNLMVFGPGGYKTVDYLRYGAPLLLLITAVIFGLCLYFI